MEQTAPVELGVEEFEQLVADALDGIPEQLGGVMDNVVVVVEDWPTEEQLEGCEGTLLGLYEGMSLIERSPMSYSDLLPDIITIFRGPLCRLAEDRDDLVNLINTTVIHEVAHHFGISDDRLEELGWA